MSRRDLSVSKAVALSDRDLLATRYLVPVRSDVVAIDSLNLETLRDDTSNLFIETFKELQIVISTRFVSSSDSVTFRLVYYLEEEQPDGSITKQVAGQSATQTVNATDNIVTASSPPSNIFLGNDVFFPRRGCQFIKIQVTALSGECDFLAGGAQ